MSTAAERPTGTVTFLFTDIEGSTRLLKQLRDDYGTALADHQRIVREELAAHDGSEIDTQGDSFFAAFRRAKDAVAASVAIQRSLAAHAWPQGTQLRVRMGIHTGEPALGGERYVGLGVHRAARIAAAGHGGQVLVSATTRELIRDDPPPDVTLRDLGEHELKDMDEPERIYQLLAPGLEEEFAPLKTSAPALAAGHEGELVQAAQETVVDMAKPWRRRRGVLLAGGIAAVALIAVVLAVLTRGGSTAEAGTIAPNAVGVIDGDSGDVDAEVSVGHAPSAVASGGSDIWVANGDDNSVSRIDAETNDVRQTIDVGGGPSGVAVGGGSVWVTNGLDGTVSRISPDADKVVQTIAVGNGPTGVAYGAGAVWVANAVEGTVSKLDPGSGRVVRTIPVAAGVSAVAVSAGRVWVVATPSAVLLALDPRTGEIVDRIGVGIEPSAVAAGAGALWVTNRSDGTLSRVDPRTGSVTDAIQVGQAPSAVVVAGGNVWVANGGGGTLARVDATRVRVAETIRLTNQPRGLAFARGSVFVAVRETGRAHRGGVLRVMSAGAIDFIDPALAYSFESWSALAMTNDGLVGFRRVGGVAGTELVPDLAAALPAPGDGGRTYTFRLRDGIRYSNGRAVQPQDFRRAIERVFEIQPVSPGASYYGGIVGTDACKPGRRCDLSRGIVADGVAGTVTFRLRAPDGDFLTKLALPWAVAVPAATPGRNIGVKAVPATGPYKVAKTGKTGTTFVRNARFRPWSEDAQPEGYPNRIVWRYLDDPLKTKEAVQQVVRGAEDVAASVVPPLGKADIDELATRYPAQLRMSTAPTTFFYFLNTRRPPFDDVRVRRAVNYALDRKAFAAALGRAVAPTCQILPPNHPSYRKTCPYGAGGVAGQDRARQLVRASGTAGQRIELWAPRPQATATEILVQALESLGYRTRVRYFVGASDYFPRLEQARTRPQMGFFAWVADFPSESGFIPPLFSCKAVASNPSGFCDPSIDRAFGRAAAVQSQNPPEGHALWQRIERRILDAAPIVPTHNARLVSFVSKRVGNFQFHPQFGVLLAQLWVR